MEKRKKKRKKDIKKKNKITEDLKSKVLLALDPKAVEARSSYRVARTKSILLKEDKG